MAATEIFSTTKLSVAFAPKDAVTDDTAQVSEILDTADFGANMLGFATGTLTDANATFTVLIEDGDNSALSDNAAVADAYLVGTEAGASFTFAEDDTAIKIGYIGPKRYIRATITPSGNTGDLHIGGLWIQADGRKQQTDQQV